MSTQCCQDCRLEQLRPAPLKVKMAKHAPVSAGRPLLSIGVVSRNDKERRDFGTHALCQSRSECHALIRVRHCEEGIRLECGREGIVPQRDTDLHHSSSAGGLAVGTRCEGEIRDGAPDSGRVHKRARYVHGVFSVTRTISHPDTE